MLRTKIICKLGPASTSPDTILALVQGGMNLARLNMSHGEREDHRAAIGLVRDAAAQVGHPVGIMVDLAGPKIRVGELGAPIELKKGKAVVMVPDDKVQPGEIPCSYHLLSREVQLGDTLLLDDGLLELRCLRLPRRLEQSHEIHLYEIRWRQPRLDRPACAVDWLA